MIDNKLAEEALGMLDRMKMSIPLLLRGKLDANRDTKQSVVTDTTCLNKLSDHCLLSNTEWTWVINQLYSALDTKRTKRLVDCEIILRQHGGLMYSAFVQILLAYLLEKQLKYIRPLVWQPVLQFPMSLTRLCQVQQFHIKDCDGDGIIDADAIHDIAYNLGGVASDRGMIDLTITAADSFTLSSSVALLQAELLHLQVQQAASPPAFGDSG